MTLDFLMIFHHDVIMTSFISTYADFCFDPGERIFLAKLRYADTIVCDLNLVSVTGTDTKVQFQYWYLSEPKCFSHFIGGYKFFVLESLKLNTDLLK